MIDADSYTAPWSPDDFRVYCHRPGSVSMVIQHRSLVVGYVVFSMHSERIELLRLAVDAGHRRQGLGLQLLRHVVAHLSDGRHKKVYAWVPDDAVHSHMMLKKAGFIATAVLEEEYYFEFHAAWLLRVY